MQEENFDEYCDSFKITAGPNGAALSFYKGEAHPDPNSMKPPVRVGTVRTSVEHLKTMAFIMRRQILIVEKEIGYSVQVPRQIQNALKIAPEDWDSFWPSPGGNT